MRFVYVFVACVYMFTLMLGYVVLKRINTNTRFRFCGLTCPATEVHVSQLAANTVDRNEVARFLAHMRSMDQKQDTQNHVSSKLAEYSDIRRAMPKTAAAMERLFEGKLLRDSPHRMFARMYNKQNDYMNWHYDDNNTMGSKLTAIVPLHVDDSCNTAQFEYMDQRDGDVHTVAVRVGEMVVYDGENVYHRVTVQRRSNCERLVLVIPLYTNSDMTLTNRVVHTLKSLFRRTF